MSTVLIFLGAWSAVAITLALLLGRTFFRNSLTRLSPRPVEGERAQLAGAADGQVSALPAAPESQPDIHR